MGMGAGLARRGAWARARRGSLARRGAPARARVRRGSLIRARRGNWAVGVAGLAVLALGAGACTNNVTGNATAGRGGSRVIDVIAAENFWGSLVSQLGGAHVNV